MAQLEEELGPDWRQVHGIEEVNDYHRFRCRRCGHNRGSEVKLWEGSLLQHIKSKKHANTLYLYGDLTWHAVPQAAALGVAPASESAEEEAEKRSESEAFSSLQITDNETQLENIIAELRAENERYRNYNLGLHAWCIRTADSSAVELAECRQELAEARADAAHLTLNPHWK